MARVRELEKMLGKFLLSDKPKKTRKRRRKPCEFCWYSNGHHAKDCKRPLK